MFSAKPSFFPRFAINNVTDGGGRVNVTEPPTDKKNAGWEYLEKPARDYMNWIHRGNYLWIDYFNQFWNSSHQLLINEIESEGGAGISILDTLKVDAITELTGSAGVTIEGITLIDGYINEPVGIKIAPVSGTNLHVNQADSAASLLRFTNSNTGATATDGFEIGIDASEQGRIWNYENTDLVIGTNNTEMLLIDNAGNIGVRNGIPLYIYSAGNDKYLSLIHNDTNALISTNSGNIYTDKLFGIGVTPSNPLHVQSTTTPQIRIAYDADSYWTFSVANGGAITLSASEATGRMTIVTGASDPYFVLSNGTTLGLNSADNLEYAIIGHNGTNLVIGTGGTNAGNIVISNTTEASAGVAALVSSGGIYSTKKIIGATSIEAGTTVTAGTGITATTGNINIVAGDLQFNGNPVAGWLADGTPYYKKVINIGDWNMDTTFSVNVAHGVTNWKTIKVVSVIIRNDADATYYPLTYGDVSGAGAMAGSVTGFNSSDIVLSRLTGGFFDGSAQFDGTSYNRGYITVIYT